MKDELEDINDWVDEVTGEARTSPDHKYAFESLMTSGEADYGKIVEWERVEELFGMKGKAQTEKFRFKYISMSGLFQDAGFLLTEGGMNGKGFRFLTREEMADKVRQRETNKANDSLRKSLTLSRVPREGLAQAEIQKLDHWEVKTAVIGATSKLLLRKRSLPSPQNVVSNLRSDLNQPPTPDNP